MLKQFAIISFAIVMVLGGCTSTDDNTITPPQSIPGATVDAQVGGEDQPNQVFIDLSTGEQKAVNRSSWDLGFYTGSDFRVVLNNTTQMLAYPLDKTDMNSVSSSDTVGLGAKVDLASIFAELFNPAPTGWLDEAITWTDNPNGDISQTAIAEISEVDTDNRVYIINLGRTPEDSRRGWMKIRVLKEGNQYNLQYAEVDATTFSSEVISKDNAFNFVFYSFQNGLVSVEPAKTNWDISFTNLTEYTSFTGPDDIVPYFFKDVVIQNRFNVETVVQVFNDPAEVLPAFTSFTRGDVAGLEFKSEVNNIRTAWRTVATPTPGSVTGVATDRFYVIKDASGIYFKLLFTKMLSNEGKRGFPQIQYELLK